jgi:putative nucleotidyltransferase with HDIG domain
MSIPTRIQAAAILRGLAPSEKLLKHSAAVAEVAAFVCAAMAARGVAIDTAVVEAAALLHDVDKALPAGDPHRALGHGTGGAAWLRSQGHLEVADAMARHPVTALAETDSYESWAANATLEARVVSYADKRALQDLVSLDDRFAYWYGRYPGSPMLPLTHQRARELERDVCATAGVEPEDIERLAWVDDALGTAT